MHKQEFLEQLGRSLSFLPKNEREERLSFYAEMIDDRIEEGLSEEEAVESLGSMEEILGKLCLERNCVEQERSKRKPGAGEIGLLVLGSPVWLPLVIVAFAVVLSLYVSLFAVVISLWAAPVSFLVAALGGVLCGLVMLFTGSPAVGLVMFAAALILTGLSVFLFFGCRAATRGSVWLTKWMSAWLKKLFQRKGEV